MLRLKLDWALFALTLTWPENKNQQEIAMDFDSSRLQLGWEQIPTMGNLYSVIKELDDMLLENSAELEQCMGNIMECIGDIPPIGKAVNIVGGSGAGSSTGGKDSSAKSTSSQYESIDSAIQSLG